MTVIIMLAKKERFAEECYYIIPKLTIALGFALVGAVLLDALFKIAEKGYFEIKGMTFYGGLICGAAALALMLKIFKKNTRLSAAEWLNALTVPFLIFHMFGRIGCFLGGCCYGRVTDSVFGMTFPDQPNVDIFHYGHKVFPTQLYEALCLLLLIVIIKIADKHRFAVYVFSYPVVRFLLEFMRGDDRGAYIGVLSPAQFISVFIFCAAIAVAILRVVNKRIVRDVNSVLSL